jgi:hypothetical protein
MIVQFFSEDTVITTFPLILSKFHIKESPFFTPRKSTIDFGTVVRSDGESGLFGCNFDFMDNHHCLRIYYIILIINLPNNIPIHLNNLPTNIPTEGRTK